MEALVGWRMNPENSKGAARVSTLCQGAQDQHLPLVCGVMAQGFPGKLLQACSKGRADRSLLSLCLRHEDLGDPANRMGSCLQGRGLICGEGWCVSDGVSGQPCGSRWWVFSVRQASRKKQGSLRCLWSRRAGCRCSNSASASSEGVSWLGPVGTGSGPCLVCQSKPGSLRGVF